MFIFKNNPIIKFYHLEGALILPSFGWGGEIISPGKNLTRGKWKKIRGELILLPPPLLPSPSLTIFLSARRGSPGL
jgi:hypothetical protein